MVRLINTFLPDKDISFFDDKPVIAIPDEWNNPIIGFVNAIEGDRLRIHDYIRDMEIIVGYRTFIFTEQRFQLILKLDPFELCSILYPEQCMEESFTMDKNVFLLKPTEINNLLRDRGFWQDLKEYREDLRHCIAH